MHIKSSEKCARGFLVCLTLLAILYVFGFLIQVLISNMRFQNTMFEKLDGEYDRAFNNHALFKNKAFAAWSEYNIQGQWRADVISGDDQEFENKIESSERETSSFINGTLAAFCDSE